MHSSLGMNQLDEMIPVIAIIFGVVGIVLPAIGLGTVKKVLTENETMAGIILVCVTLICLTGMVVGGAIILAMIGWLPSPAALFRG